MGAVLCKPYAVMPEQFLPSGTNSRFSHYCRNYDRGMGLGERADFQENSGVVPKNQRTRPELL